jgi:hypothetical protein
LLPLGARSTRSLGTLRTKLEDHVAIMDVPPTDAVKLLADGLTLVYHEARHVRHLVRASHLSATGWERLLSLPTNRVAAWRTLQDTRKAAAEAQTVQKAAGRFEKRFAMSLASLQDLYTNEHWKHAEGVGGHAWRGVTAAVSALRDAIEWGDAGEIEGAAQSLLRARHNNGTVRDKIAELDAAIGIQSGQWWQRAAGA